ncbi:MAG: hypothetical protein H7122_17350 [Chitinophagaceae bacterium]|nr:hypothetical protein [Chitinophagaceae bacterium]
MIKIFLLTFCFAMAWIFGPAQQQNPFSQFRVEHWDSKKGLPNDLVLTMHQSKDGFLWLTSYSSLARFDGVNFKSFNSRTVPLMKTDIVESAIAETADSTLWIPTPNSGLLAYKNGQFKAFLSGYNSLRLLAASDKGELLFLTNTSKNPFLFFATSSKKFTELDFAARDALFKEGRLFSPNSVDKSGTQWRLINNNLTRITRSKIDTILLNTEVNPYLKGTRPDQNYNEVYVDKKNRIWLSSENGLYLWKDTTMELYPGMENKAFIKNAYTSGLLLEDRRGGLWAATTSGLAYMPANSETFAFIPENHPLRSQSITNLLEDKEGNIWLSSQDGIYKLSYCKFTNYSVQDGLSDNRVSGICAIDSVRYMVGSLGKLFWVEQGLVRPYIFKNREAGEKIREVFHLYLDSRGNIWVCTNSYIIKISPQGEKLIAAKGNPRYVYEDGDKRIWLGMPYTGIGFLNGNDEIEMLNLPKVNFKPMFISTIRKLKNGNWLVTTFNKGAFIIDKSGEAVYLNEPGDLPNIGVFDSYEDEDGVIWLPTQAGLSRYKDGKLSNIGFKDGLPENALFGFLPDDQGYIWFPSNRGLLRARKQELVDYFDKKIEKIDWRLYDDADGMLDRQCVGARHSAITSSGKLLIPTFGGLVEIDPDKLISNPHPPPVVIHAVVRDSSTIDLSKDNIFTPGNHRYVFQYSGLSLVAPEKVQIRFRLIGYDKDWINSVGDRRAYYTNIPSGDYTFQVIASNNDGIWNETGASFHFIIKPFFYETVWFRILVVVALLLFIWIVVRWRTSVVRKQNESLEAQVTSRTKDLNKANLELNQSNTAIATQRDSLEKTLTELKSAQSQLIQSEKMASLGELTAGIAHEIQNPLNFVNNFSEVSKELLDEMKTELNNGNTKEVKQIAGDVIQNLEKILHHGKRADSIVKGMLQHSRTSSGQKEPTDINALADEYLRLAYHGLRAKEKAFNATLNTDYDESIGQINIIPQDIGRVILNLITNAFYVVGEKRQRESENYQPTVSISTKRIGDKVEIKVADNGNGIPQKILDKIFQPFFTTKPTGQGTGLGLSLSYDIVKAHGGEMGVKTKESEGTIFIISIPIIKQ